MDESAVVLLESYTFEFPDHQHPLTIDCSGYSQGPLATELLTALVRISKSAGSLRHATVKRRAGHISTFCRGIQQHRPEVQSATELLPSDLDWWERHLHAQYPQGRTAFTYLASIKGLLTECAAFLDLREDFKYRLHQPTMLPTNDVTPYEAYTDDELAAIRKLAQQVHQKAVSRIVTNRCTLSELSLDAQSVIEDVLAGKKLPPIGGGLRKRLAQAGTPTARLPLTVCPSSTDLLAFVVLIALETGWNPSTILNLRVDCLVNPTNGKVGVRTFKPRRGEQAHETVYVRDRGPLSAGGLIRTAIEITAPLRQATARSDLWLWWTPEKACVCDSRNLTIKPLLQLFASAGGAVFGENGFPVLQLVRIRKSVKARQYKEAGGDLRALTGHSATVAATHYANLPSMAEQHLGAVRDALAAMLDVASMRRQDDAPVDQDTLSVACTSPTTSPYAPSGSMCLADPGMCFGCPNSVVSLRHLPQVLAHADQLAQAAQELSAQEWVAAHGATWLRIHEGLLPQFSEQEIAAGRGQVGSRVLLPLHVRGTAR